MTVLRLVTPPATTPVTVAELKAHLRIEADTEDAVLEAYLAAAVAYLDGWRGVLGIALMSQVWELVLDAFPAAEVQIPLTPVLSIGSVEYDNEDGDQITLAAEEYQLDAASRPAWLIPVTSWPSTFDGANAVRIRFTAGHASADDVPAPIKQAIKLMVGAWYENREDTVIGASVSKLPLPSAADALLALYRPVL